MDFDTEKLLEKEGEMRSLIKVSLMGGIGIIIPFLAVFVATFRGMSELSMFNSTMLMILSVLILVFLLVRTANAFFTNSPKLFVSGIIFIVICLISLIFNLMSYVML